jgi:hypothetical protein
LSLLKVPKNLRRRILLLPAVLLAVLAGGWYSLRVMQQSQRLLSGLQALPALLSDRTRLTAEGPAALVRSRAELQALQRLLGPLPQLGRGLAWLPTLGPTLAAGAPLLTAADQSLLAAELLLQAAQPVLLNEPAALLQDPALPALLQSVTPQLLAAQQAAHAAETAWQALPPRDQLLPPLRERLARYEPPARLLVPAADSAVLAALLATTVQPLLQLAPALSGDPLLVLARAGPGLLAPLSAADQQREPLTAAAATARTGLAALDRTALPQAVQSLPAVLDQLPLLTDALLLTLDAAAPLPALLQVLDAGRAADGERITRLVDGLAALTPQLTTAAADAHAAAAAWQALAFPQLPAALRRAPADLAAAYQLLAVLPPLLGSAGERQYLLLALNNDELRPAGGFITSAGVLSITRGRITPPTMEDSGRIRPRPGLAAPAAPPPLVEAMRLDQWYFLDAAWPADFPTAAQTARRFYQQSGRSAPADVVAVDLDALEQLVGAFGPLALSEAVQPLATAADVRAYMQQQYAVSGDNSDVLGTLARALIARIDDGDTPLPQLLLTLGALADQRHLQIAVSDPAAAAVFAARGWDGALVAGAQDQLLLFDANVGYSKSSRNIAQIVDYRVDLRAPLSPRAEFSLTRRYDAPAQLICPPELADYAVLASRCQHSYLQLLVPPAATLLAVDLPPTFAGWWWGAGLPFDGLRVSDAPAGSRSFAWYSSLFPGETQQTRLSYSLPARVLQATADGRLDYRLRVQRQAGSAPFLLRLELQLPAGYRILESSVALSGNRAELLIERHQTINITIGR